MFERSPFRDDLADAAYLLLRVATLVTALLAVLIFAAGRLTVVGWLTS